MSEVSASPLAVLAERTAERRARRGLTRPELVRRMNATRFAPNLKGHSHIGNIEGAQGEKLPSVPALAAMAEALGTSMDYLAGLTDNPAPMRQTAHRVAADAADEEERALLQELFELIHGRGREEQRFIAAVVRRLAAGPSPKPPVIFGGADNTE